MTMGTVFLRGVEFQFAGGSVEVEMIEVLTGEILRFKLSRKVRPPAKRGMTYTADWERLRMLLLQTVTSRYGSLCVMGFSVPASEVLSRSLKLTIRGLRALFTGRSKELEITFFKKT